MDEKKNFLTNFVISYAT